MTTIKILRPAISLKKIVISVLFLLIVPAFVIAKTNPPKKTYELHLNYPSFGEVDFYMFFVFDTDSTFYAYTNPNSIYQILPFYKRWMLKIFAKGKEPGAVIQVENGKRKGDDYLGTVSSHIGHIDSMNATIIGTKIKGYFSVGKIQLSFNGTEVDTIVPLGNYKKLASVFRETIEQKIYNPTILNRKDWKRFLKKMDKGFKRANDDLDVFLDFYYYLAKLKTSHVYLSKKDVMRVSDSTSSSITFKKLNKQISLMHIKHFLLRDTSVIEHYLSEIETPNLIIDIRDCPGGDFSSIALASHFIDSSSYVGYFLGRKYYKQGHENLPTKSYLKAQKPFTKGSLKDFFQVIYKKGILVGKVNPSPLHYDGNVYVLINKNTASAAEPFAYFMKNKHIATLIGQNTAGMMLSARAFHIYKKWWITLPISNYYTMDNKHLDQVGVQPNIIVESDKALKKAKEIINGKEEGN